ncbi:chloride channel protein [Embleya sp. NPDC059259]|uniref:chloride channel protein n=1 Tax=unclassified Embleya TaxID=2699296 RepID=UPI0036CE2D4E
MPVERASEAAETRELHDVLSSPGYLRLLLLSALVGIPISLAAFGFLAAEHAAQNGLWEHLPHELGYADPPWWWPLPLLTLAGSIVAAVSSYLPGKGGHLPVEGLGGRPTAPSALPGVLLAALASLPLGAVLGPESPLMALGSGLALVAVRSARRAAAPRLVAVLAAVGSTAAIATVFGNPLVAAVLVIEAAGMGGPRLFALILPCLLASGVGGVVFTGFGSWSGLSIGSLSLSTLPPSRSLRVGDVLWGVPLAAAIACGVVLAMTFARRVADRAAGRAAWWSVGGGIGVGVLIAAYALCTDRSPAEAALSGQSTLAVLAADPNAWPVSALALLLVFKGAAWSLSMATLRGGPVFPVLLLGGAAGVLCASLPGLATLSGLAVGLAAAGSATLRLPVSATVLAAMLLGKDAAAELPLLIIASVVAFVVGELLRGRWMRRPAEPAEPAEPPATGSAEPGAPARE